ncbi:hypothetical protein BU16DRAFT_563450 [Lophium mytilinum]|uniref:Uncharacterized protein n=1 Tax=Lophium mytilinum TaxID=390894 RepID=A0A6A6QLP6_9PEZI|nr:hypothetical protein BU16DRAFT_563450 [Lophium mytilinum]
MAPILDQIPTFNTTGNILEWRIPGSHFRDPLPTATFVAAALCFLFFFGHYVVTCCLCCWKRKNKSKSKNFIWQFRFSSAILMLYFAVYTADRVLTEINEKRVVMYYPFLIVLETMTLFADAWLMVFLLGAFTLLLYEHAGAKKESNSLMMVGLRLITWGLMLLAAANPAAFIYYLVSNRLLSEETKQAIANTGGPRVEILTAYTKITLAFYCIYFGAAIILTWITIYILRKLHRRQTPAKAIRVGLPLLVACVDARSLVQLVFAAAFTYKPHTESGVVKLLRLLFYGFLSIGIYSTFMWISGSDDLKEKDDANVHKDVNYTPGVPEATPQPVYYGDVITAYTGKQVTWNAHPVPQNMHHDGSYTFRNA